MPAFLSHSSKDKHFVTKVADELGPLLAEIDERTFDYVLNAQAIRGALKRSDLVVFFLSQHSVASAFVREEQRQTQEAIARGGVRKVAIFSLDGTTHQYLPEWLREINIVQQVSSAKACARRIQAMLIEIDLGTQPELLYLGRDEDEKTVRHALAKPSALSPIALHIVGFHGIGRRTFIQNTLRKLYPRFYSVFISHTASQHQGISEFYRAVHGLHVVSSNQDRIDDFITFDGRPRAEQISETAAIVRAMAEAGEFLLIFDDGNGVYDDTGHLQEHWVELLSALESLRRPALGFVQTRMQPYRYRGEGPKRLHHRLEALSLDASREIISFSLKQNDVEFDEPGLQSLAQLAGGHPYNIRFAIGLATAYGVEPFLKEPSHFISWRDRRGEDFLVARI
jgi:hypothetical protein